MIKAVGFDLDNTLYKVNDRMDNLIRNYIITKASLILNRDVKEEFNNYFKEFQSGRRSLLALGIKDAAELVQEALEKADISLELKPDKELVSLLNDLSKVYTLYLITSSAETEALKKLKALNIDFNLFSIKLYNDCKYKREDTTVFPYVASLLELRVNELMFVGDREYVDILPANKLGVITAIVNAKSEHATYELERIYDLRRILLKK